MRAIALREVGRRRGRIALLAAFGFMHAAGHAGLALLGGAVVVVLGGGHPVQTGSSFMDMGNPVVLAAFAAGASAARLFGSAAGAYLAASTSGDVSTVLRGRVLGALFAVQRLRRPRQEDHGRPCVSVGDHARAVSALTLRIREVASALETATHGARALLQVVLLAAVGAFVAPRLFVAALAVLLPFSILLGRLRSKLRAAQRADLEHADALLEAADEAVRHGELWRVFGATRKIATHIKRLGDEARDRAARLSALATAQTGANELLGIGAVVLALWAVSRFSPADAAVLGPFAVPFFLAYRPLRDLAEARVAMSRAEQAAWDLDAVLADGAASDSAVVTTSSGVRSWPLAALELDALAHARVTWSPLSLVIEPGSIVAVVGKTGSGKTTLLRILLGLEDAGGGHVRYGGESLAGRTVGPGARPFVWVPQDAPVLAATLEENVLLMDDADATRGGDDARALLASIGAGSLSGLGEERLGSGHRPVSGGERQWLSISRALATRSPVLLLDEPTAGLDAGSERAVLDALARLRGTRTIVIVTHRDAPMRIADRVVRLDDRESLPASRSEVRASA